MVNHSKKIYSALWKKAVHRIVTAGNGGRLFLDGNLQNRKQ